MLRRWLIINPYGGLSLIYDYLVAGVDFESWIDYVEKILSHYGYCPSSVLDLACGTGNTIIPFARRGYKTLGLDISGEMIAVARAKAREECLAIDYLVGDLRSFKLNEPVELATCFHDGLNYLLTRSDLGDAFNCVADSLVEGGMFIFDLNAVKWIGEVDDNPVVIEEKDLTIIYRTIHDRENSLWSVNLTGFVREGELYRKFTENHRERGYDPEDVKTPLESAGLILLAVYDAFTFSPVHPGSRRHFYVARKQTI